MRQAGTSGEDRGPSRRDQVPAVVHRQIHEIKSAYILQLGPAALTEGVARLQRIVQEWARIV